MRGYDPKCDELSRYFLADDEQRSQAQAILEGKIESLAQAVQDAVEEWLAANP